MRKEVQRSAFVVYFHSEKAFGKIEYHLYIYINKGKLVCNITRFRQYNITIYELSHVQINEVFPISFVTIAVVRQLPEFCIVQYLQ